MPLNSSVPCSLTCQHLHTQTSLDSAMTKAQPKSCGRSFRFRHQWGSGSKSYWDLRLVGAIILNEQSFERDDAMIAAKVLQMILSPANAFTRSSPHLSHQRTCPSLLKHTQEAAQLDSFSYTRCLRKLGRLLSGMNWAMQGKEVAFCRTGTCVWGSETFPLLKGLQII